MLNYANIKLIIGGVMEKNLVIFFNDGESDNLNEKATKLLTHSLGSNFLLLFKKDLDNQTKLRISKSSNIFAYVNPYWNTSLEEFEKHHLANLLSSLSELASQTPTLNVFVIPYTTILQDLSSREYDHFYKLMDAGFKNNNCPNNLLVAKREDAFYGKLTSHYQWISLGQEIKKITEAPSTFVDMYRELKQQNKADIFNQNHTRVS